MNSEFREYIEAEIPAVKEHPTISRSFALWKIRMTQPAYDAIYMFRFCFVYLHGRSVIKKLIARRYKRLLVHRYALFFDFRKGIKVGKGLKFPHPSSIIIGSYANIGENCTIYQNVTIGAARRGEGAEKKYPVIGDNCILYAGCKVLGSIKLADGTAVGANAVLLKNTEENSVYAGVPAERIK